MTTQNGAVVLCVAAEQVSLSVRGLVLQSEGYSVISASTPEDALRLSAQRQPDVIICEHPLGKGNGVEVAKRLKEVNPDTPILLITDPMDSIPQTLAVDAYMTKIDGPQALLRSVAALLDSKSGTHAA
jgi:two-component system response regulator GlrR